MKNPTIERLKRSAKQYHRSSRHYFEDGVRLFHSYTTEEIDSLSWWDDIQCIVNDYTVHISWQHPRLAFDDLLSEYVDTQMAENHSHLEPQPIDWSTSVPRYEKQGRSRKKVVGYVRDVGTSVDWLEARNRLRQGFLPSFETEVRPLMNMCWGRRFRRLSLCIPVEVRNDEEARALAYLAKKLIKREVTLNELFPDYRYTKDNWIREGNHLFDEQLHAHKLLPT